MEDTTGNMFNDVNYLIECQRFVVERVKFLEGKRLELSNIIRNLNDSEYKETLENKIDKLEMKLFIDGVTDKVIDKAEVSDECVETKKISKKCRYNNRGFCKRQSECIFFHSEKICENFASNGKCLEPETCLQRHPKDCKYWMGDARGCLRGDECKYLHISRKKGMNMKSNKSCHKIKNDKEIMNEKKDKESIDSIKEAVDAKDEELKQKDGQISELISEKEGLTEQYNKIKRCAMNMDKEIKLLRSRTH